VYNNPHQQLLPSPLSHSVADRQSLYNTNIMMLTTATRRIASKVATSQSKGMSTVAFQTATSSFADVTPAYVAEAPTPTISELGNGVKVVSLFGGSATGSSYTSVRVSGVGSRFDKVGGEHALLANLTGGEVGREHLSFSSVAAASSALTGNVAGDVEAAKAYQISKVANSSYETQMMDQVHFTAYQNSPSGNSLANALEGTADSISSLSASSVSSLGANVFGSDVCVVCTGSGEHDKLVEEVDNALGSLKSAGSGKEVAAVGEKAAFIGSDIRIRYDSHDTATIALAFEGASWTDPKAMPLALMSTILGSFNVSSGLGKDVSPALCQEVAINGVASSVAAFNLSYSDTGLFGMVATAPDNKLDDLMWYAMPNFVRLAHGISEEELVRAKITLKARILSSLDGDIATGEEMARQMQTIGRVMPLAEMLARVDALTMDDVKATANDVINDQDHALAAIGGIHELPDYNWIRRHSYMLRY